MVQRWRLCRAELRACIGRVTRKAVSSGEEAGSESIVYSVAAPKVCRYLKQTRYSEASLSKPKTGVGGP